VLPVEPLPQQVLLLRLVLAVLLLQEPLLVQGLELVQAPELVQQQLQLRLNCEHCFARL
jgi:hypothetical protein